jgi:hypothetical protein
MNLCLSHGEVRSNAVMAKTSSRFSSENNVKKGAKEPRAVPCYLK